MSFDKIEFRNTLGTFATGVCVVTANPEGDAPFGMTINSFSSVSLEPALVLWSIQNNSECFPAFEKAKTYAINILADDQEAISNAYAKKGSHDLDESHYYLGKNGTPILRGAVASFECKVWARYPGGDHEILVGEVMGYESNPNKDPLLFHCGKYNSLK